MLVRTSNPGSAELQDVKLADGRTWSEMLADALAPVAAPEGLVGTSGYSSIGAVVGATQPHTMPSLRAAAAQVDLPPPRLRRAGRHGRNDPRAPSSRRPGAIVSASRSILYAHSEPKYAERFGDDWEKCVEQAVLDMKGGPATRAGGEVIPTRATVTPSSSFSPAGSQ